MVGTEVMTDPLLPIYSLTSIGVPILLELLNPWWKALVVTLVLALALYTSDRIVRKHMGSKEGTRDED
jgi:hypothetical protein